MLLNKSFSAMVKDCVTDNMDLVQHPADHSAPGKSASNEIYFFGAEPIVGVLGDLC